MGLEEFGMSLDEKKKVALVVAGVGLIIGTGIYAMDVGSSFIQVSGISKGYNTKNYSDFSSCAELIDSLVKQKFTFSEFNGKDAMISVEFKRDNSVVRINISDGDPKYNKSGRVSSEAVTGIADTVTTYTSQSFTEASSYLDGLIEKEYTLLSFTPLEDNFFLELRNNNDVIHLIIG